MDEYLVKSLDSALNNFDFLTAEWIGQQLIDKCRYSHISRKIPAYIRLARVYVTQGEHEQALSVLSHLPMSEEVLYLTAFCQYVFFLLLLFL